MSEHRASTLVRPATDADLDQLVELNAAAVPAVSVADRPKMAELVEMATLAWVVDGASGPAASDGPSALDAFVLLFEPGSAYGSPNYLWFAERYERFLYVDRIVVAEGARGSGLGARLYDEAAAEAVRRGSTRVTAEVNVVPPNPGSSRFHRRHGFEAVGELRFADDYVVEMLARPVG